MYITIKVDFDILLLKDGFKSFCRTAHILKSYGRIIGRIYNTAPIFKLATVLHVQ